MKRLRPYRDPSSEQWAPVPILKIVLALVVVLLVAVSIIWRPD